MGKINDFINEVSNLFVEIAPYLILGFIVSGFLYMFTSKEMITKNVGTPGFMSVLKASILGVPMPLCSCGVIPVSTSMYKRGATKGATLSFLISTPQTGVDSILLTLNQMGPQFAIIRPIVALITGVIGGMFGDLISDNDYKSTANVKHKHEPKSLLDGLKYSFITLPQDVIKPLIKGIIISGFISILLPNDFFASYNLTGITAMIIIAIASVPIYVCATTSVPIAMMLISKGLEPGAAFVFLMAGPATNAATISVIINSLGKKIVYVYISVIFISSIIFGLLINAFLDPNSLPMNMHHGHSRNIIWNIFSQLSVSGMIIITGYTLFSQFKGQSKNDTNLNQSVDLSIIIKGMTCNHCTETATEAINSCHGVEDVSVDLESGQALISGKNLDEKEIITSINSVGFSISNLS